MTSLARVAAGDVDVRLSRPSATLREAYGFEFPDDFYSFWDFARRLRPLEPVRALEELHVTLVGPFEVLAGRFDGRHPQLPLTLHWRYYADPPEFFTVLAGETAGLHWGYYLDDPPEGPELHRVVLCAGCVRTVGRRGDVV